MIAQENFRHSQASSRRGWPGVKNRCIVPATSFCEYEDTKPRKTPTWFALSEARALVAFAGLWSRWRGTRGPKSAPVEGEYELFGFLGSQRGCRAHSSQGHVSDPDDIGRHRSVARWRHDGGPYNDRSKQLHRKRGGR